MGTPARLLPLAASGYRCPPSCLCSVAGVSTPKQHAEAFTSNGAVLRALESEAVRTARPGNSCSKEHGEVLLDGMKVSGCSVCRARGYATVLKWGGWGGNWRHLPVLLGPVEGRLQAEKQNAPARDRTWDLGLPYIHTRPTHCHCATRAGVDFGHYRLSHTTVQAVSACRGTPSDASNPYNE